MSIVQSMRCFGVLRLWARKVVRSANVACVGDSRDHETRQAETYDHLSLREVANIFCARASSEHIFGGRNHYDIRAFNVSNLI
jgi:hypothetical protein